jgi:hypothetical protein
MSYYPEKKRGFPRNLVISGVCILYSNHGSISMTEMALLDVVRHIPEHKRQELYDFAHFLAEKYTNVQSEERIAAFESEDEMIDFITDIGRQVAATDAQS